MNQTAIFEDERWSKGPQALVFRHGVALSYIDSRMRLLDVACGDGLFLAMAAEKGAIVAGADISDQAIEKAKARGIERLVKCDVATQELPFIDGEFDAVSALDVLEHVLDPERALREIRRVTKDFVIISVPNFSSLPSRLQCLLGKVPENNKPNKGHVYWFNRLVLGDLLKKTGLEIVEIRQNHQGMGLPLIGPTISWLVRLWPNLFALSYVVLLKKRNQAPGVVI